ncbi:unnamed protein product [Ophioblennius macclurei]
MSALVLNAVGDGNSVGFDLMQNRIESLSSKMDKLINIQEKVLNRLDGMSQDIDDIEKDMENLKVDKEEIHLPPKMANHTQVVGREVREICREMSTIMTAVNRRTEQQAQKLEGMEKLVLSMQQVISFIGETVKTSRVVDLMFKGPAARKGSKLKDHKGKQAVRRKSSSDTLTKKLDKLKDHKGKDGTEKPFVSSKGQKAPKKMKPPDTSDNIPLKKQALLLEEVQKLNKENAEKSGHRLASGHLDLEAGVSPKDGQPDASTSNLVDYLREDSQVVAVKKQEDAEVISEEEEEVEEVEEEEEEEEAEEVVAEKADEKKAAVPEKESKDEGKQKDEGKLKAQEEKQELKTTPAVPEEKEKVSKLLNKETTTPRPETTKDAAVSPKTEKDQTPEATSTNIKSFVTEEHFVVEEHMQSLVVKVEDKQEEKEKEEEEEEEEEEEKRQDNEDDEEKLESEGWAVFKADGVEYKLNLKQRVEDERKENIAEKEEEDDDAERYYIDTTAPPAAPFNHRIVSAKPSQIRNFYTINWQEVLGGGRFGQVHKCVENSSGLTLAAKVIKARSQKEKEVVKNEIQVMNNLDHASLIQLYAAYESRNDIILVLEYVGGGELFDRIIDENYTLMELDAVVFIRQICEGLQHMHKMSVLHLDLKPENILCVSRVTNKVKIIDFGLARMYKPREKLKVNFGTPEFLAPEVINYDFVSYNTDMWSLGVITYMLLSGLCPFLGDDDNQTLNNILACQWNFEEQEFIETSEQAKDFISRLLQMNRSWRMGACEALNHPWLSDAVLHHRLYTKKTMCRSRRSSCVPTTDS